MPDDELPCLCIANIMAPAAHKRGERCPSWDLLLYGNAYGVKQPDGKLNWLDPKDVIIKQREPVTVNSGNSKYDTRPRRLVLYVLNPGRLVLGLLVAWVVAWLDTHHHVGQAAFWEAYLGWTIGMLTVFFLREAYIWAGSQTEK